MFADILKTLFVVAALVWGCFALAYAFRGCLRGESSTDWGLYYYSGSISLGIGAIFSMVLLGV